jgi:hypothetical protein
LAFCANARGADAAKPMRERQACDTSARNDTTARWILLAFGHVVNYQAAHQDIKNLRLKSRIVRFGSRTHPSD